MFSFVVSDSFASLLHVLEKERVGINESGHDVVVKRVKTCRFASCQEISVKWGNLLCFRVHVCVVRYFC